MNNQPTIQEYLDSKNIEYKLRGEQLWTKCLLSTCDDDSRPNEYHLSFNVETGQYYCQKCNKKGNLITLMAHLGDSQIQKTTPRVAPQRKNALYYNQRMPQQVKDYLINERGFHEWLIADKKLGYGSFYGHEWITIPVEGVDDSQALKLRKLPWDNTNPNKYMWSQKQSAMLFNGNELLSNKSEDVLICEGELDTLMAYQQGLHSAVSSTAGAGTFKEDWLAYFKYVKTVWVCLDNDPQGEAGAKHIVELFSTHRPDITVMQIILPESLGDKADLTDYFVRGEADPDKLFTTYAAHVGGEEPIDTSDFTEMSVKDLSAILGQTIVKDEENKCILFLGMLSAYTEQDQLNIFLNGPSSSGKTYLATEVAKYFPLDDIEQYASASPTAFIHRKPMIDPKTGQAYVDCERKILIFLELPHHKLQANLRPLLSHDEKEIKFLTTDKNKRGGNDTKETVLRGFSATVFCSASMHMDEQEATRAILLSPDVNQEKLNAGIRLSAMRNAHPEQYTLNIEANTLRKQLKLRIRAIKRLRVNSVIIPSPERVLSQFTALTKYPKPRHQRDIAHLESLIKSVALLNAWSRLDEHNNVIANELDIKQAFDLWRVVSASQELGIPPYAHNFYKSFIVPTFNEKNDARNPEFLEQTGAIGITRRELCKKHFELTGQMPNEDSLRKNVLPTLEAAGLITQEKDPTNGKQVLIYPKMDVEEHSGDDTTEVNYSEAVEHFMKPDG